MNNTPSFPIVLISASRTGSNAYAEILSKKYNIPKFIHPYYANSLGALLDYNKNSNQYVIKAHADEINTYNKELIELFRGGYIISILRRDIIAQTASHYIARMTKKWTHVQNSDLSFSIGLNDAEFNNSVKTIARENLAVKEFPIKFDDEVFYEDINFEESSHIQTPKPDNYMQILNIIRDLIK